jgi:hypothetical protein
LLCPVCRAMAPLGTRRCMYCRTKLAGVVPTPINMPGGNPQWQPYGQQQAMELPPIPAKKRSRGQQQAMQPPQPFVKQRRKRKLGFWWALGLGIAAFFVFGGASPHGSASGASVIAIIVFIICLFI